MSTSVSRAAPLLRCCALGFGVQVSLFDASDVQGSAPSFKYLKRVRRALMKVKAVIAVEIASLSDLHIVGNSRFGGHVYILPTAPMSGIALRKKCLFRARHQDCLRQEVSAVA